MSSEIAIKLEGLSKCYEIYVQPRDRLKQFMLPRLHWLLGKKGKQYFREFWAINDVSFEINKGETVGIIGRNGSGKSTLLQMICGTLNPTSGTIVTKGRIAALLELGSGFNPEFTGRENVYMNGAVLGLTKEEIDARFDDILKFADIGNFIEQPTKTYSSGMLMRLAFSVAINVDPEILIVDEALSVGDELFQRKCFSRIEAIRAKGTTILFVSHSAAQIVELCNRAILMDRGEKLAIGTPKEIVSQYLKLLYAPAGRDQQIRAEIASNSIKPHEHNKAAISSNTNTVVESSSDITLETFDPNLVPSSTMEFESHGPMIGTPEILNSDGERVNGLIRGRRYLYRYPVSFNEPAIQVRFGMSIKSTSGFSLFGALTAPSPSEAIPVVDRGTIAQVEFSFDCHLNPGIYFLNAGVFGAINENEVVLHRKVDVAAFRVSSISRNIETEAVSLNTKPAVTLNAEL